ncbi:MAG: RluA family pseudouridine synthase [Candidatus Izemoplasmatales bacterium]
MNNDLQILFEDNHLLVTVKPAGILSQAGEKELPDMLSILKNYLKDKYQKPGNVYLGLVHRLDLNVGGVMVFAKTSKAASRLSESIREHDFSKRYYAVVNGILPIGQPQTLSNYLAKNEMTKMGFVTDQEQGKLAQLSYTAIEQYQDNHQKLTLIKIDLLSGRFHQIRLQMATIGHPLYGDNKYGNTLLKQQQEGMGLFAYELVFPHPITHEDMVFNALPETAIFTKFAFFSLQK